MKAAKMITNTYASAGWGITNVLDIKFEGMTVIIKMKDSWVYKINIAQEKDKAVTFLPLIKLECLQLQSFNKFSSGGLILCKGSDK